MVIRTPLRSLRSSSIPFHSPPLSSPHSSPPSSGPSSSSNSTSSSTTTTTQSSSSTSSSMAAFRPIVQEIYAALLLPNILNDFPVGYLKHLPRFNGETRFSTEDHLATFLDFFDNMNIEHENFYMRFFVQCLEGNVRIWFRQLPFHSIISCEELTTIFKNQWGVKKDRVYLLTYFEELKRNYGEPVADFIKIFNKIYHKMPPDCKPLVAAVKVIFSKAFEDDFVVMLRERKTHTLEDMKTNAIEVEENRFSLSKLKSKAKKSQRKLKSN